jgi:hypothetical protein
MTHDEEMRLIRAGRGTVVLIEALTKEVIKMRDIYEERHRTYQYETKVLKDRIDGLEEQLSLMRQYTQPTGS